METNHQFIVDRTGVTERRHADKKTTTSDLMAVAGQRALEDAGLSTDDIQMIIVNTLSPDYHDPSQACLMAKKLGLSNAVAFDIRAQCSGAIYGIGIARSFVAIGHYDNILVICGEMLSKRMDISNAGRNLSVLLARPGPYRSFQTPHFYRPAFLAVTGTNHPPK